MHHQKCVCPILFALCLCEGQVDRRKEDRKKEREKKMFVKLDVSKKKTERERNLYIMECFEKHRGRR